MANRMIVQISEKFALPIIAMAVRKKNKIYIFPNKML